MHWKNAHSDWLQFPIEFGWGGLALLIVALLAWVPGSLKFIRSPRCYLFVPWIGAGCMILHAIWEFVFQAPSLVLVFMILWTSPWFFGNLKRPKSIPNPRRSRAESSAKERIKLSRSLAP